MKIGINGFGRIGRAIFRINMESKRLSIPIINDVNPDVQSVAYMLNYDTTYDALKHKFYVSGGSITNNDLIVHVSQNRDIDEVDWSGYGVEVVVDASGTKENLIKARSVIERNASVKKVIITHAPDDVDYTMILGANENGYDFAKHHVISSSICDATAIAPVLRIIMDKYTLDCASITTVHPLLGYQNVLDGLSASWSMPGQTHSHYPLGRSIMGNLIPKPTTAVSATCNVFSNDELNESRVGSFSYRTPTAIVASSDITLLLKEGTDTATIMRLFKSYEERQKWDIVQCSDLPLVSLDYKKSTFSAIIDERWTQVVNDKLVKLILWYDNEWGYASRVCDQIEYIMERC